MGISETMVKPEEAEFGNYPGTKVLSHRLTTFTSAAIFLVNLLSSLIQTVLFQANNNSLPRTLCFAFYSFHHFPSSLPAVIV
jgi:hypothetical protein